jgi:hypothetical protein
VPPHPRRRYDSRPRVRHRHQHPAPTPERCGTRWRGREGCRDRSTTPPGSGRWAWRRCRRGCRCVRDTPNSRPRRTVGSPLAIARRHRTSVAGRCRVVSKTVPVSRVSSASQARQREAGKCPGAWHKRRSGRGWLHMSRRLLPAAQGSEPTRLARRPRSCARCIAAIICRHEWDQDAWPTLHHGAPRSAGQPRPYGLSPTLAAARVGQIADDLGRLAPS